MSAEQGVYVELLPEGKIKRDLAGILDEVSFAQAKISDEIFLFSELIFEPYAAVVDLIRSQARTILMYDDHGGLANMTLFQFMLDTVEDLVSTLEQENPLHGTLLRAQLEDEVPPDDGTAMYPFRASKKILTILVGVMQFQFVVNEVLHDIQTGESLISDKYDTLWEIPMRSILRWDGDGLTTQYHFRSAVDYYHFLLLQFVSGLPSRRRVVPLLRAVFHSENEEENPLLRPNFKGRQDLQGVGAGAQAPAESRPDQCGGGV